MARIREAVPLVVAALAFVALWQLLTDGGGLLPLPFFPSPVKVFSVFFLDYRSLAISALHSLRLLFLGFAIGAGAGLITGVLMGWYLPVRYWLGAVLRFIGPLPATAWIPLALAIFPTSFSASVFILALATWFPVTIMTWSGISNVPRAYFEVAQTLGAREGFLIRHVAVPAALPYIFVGLFMGLGTSFTTLVVAELLGVKAGLGWYIQWHMGWGEYYKVYAALLTMAALFSLIITGLFRLRDRVLAWQRGFIKW